MKRVFLHKSKTELSYKVIEHGQPILLLHGLMLDHRVMEACMEPIFTSTKPGLWKRYYVDLPGMGESPATSATTSAAILEVLEEFIEHLGAESICLVGYSYGAYLAQGLLQRFKDRIAGLFLFCPVVIANKAERTLPSHTTVAQNSDYATIAPTCNDLEREVLAALTVQSVECWNRVQQEVMVGIKKADMGFIEKVQASYTLPHEGILRTKKAEPLQTKALIVCGRQDAMVGFTDAMLLLERMDNASLHVIANAGHNVQIEQPSVFTYLASSWLAQLGTLPTSN